MRAVLLNSPAAQIANGELRLEKFKSADPEVVALIAHAEDPEAAVRRVLSVGARALNLAAEAAEDSTKR
jgi:hypothetical protein